MSVTWIVMYISCIVSSMNNSSSIGVTQIRFDNNSDILEIKILSIFTGF